MNEIYVVYEGKDNKHHWGKFNHEGMSKAGNSVKYSGIFPDGRTGISLAMPENVFNNQEDAKERTKYLNNLHDLPYNQIDIWLDELHYANDAMTLPHIPYSYHYLYGELVRRERLGE